MHLAPIPFRPTPFLVIPPAILVIDRLTWDAAPGCGVALAQLAVGGLLLARHPHLRHSLAGLGALTALLFCAFAGVWEQGVLPVLLGMLVLLVLAICGRCGTVPDALAVAERAVTGVFGLLARPFVDARVARRWRQRRGVRAWRILGWGVPLLFGSLFAGLFLAANPVFAERLQAVWAWVGDLLTVPDPLRILAWWAIGGGVWWLLRNRWRGGSAAVAIPAPARDRGQLVRRSLVVFHGLFLLQNGCDFLYLWGGLHLPPGMSYADYAHRGAYPLVATALLAAAFILAWFRPGSPVQGDPWCRRLVLAWVGQNLILLVSALWRLHLYVDAFGLSRWRVAAAVWMILVGIGLALIAWRIRTDRANRWLVNANLAALGAVLGLLAWLDIDGLIVTHNLAHRGPAFDLPYLESLGSAALPGLRSLAADGDPAAQAAVARLEARLRADLGDWRSWTVRRAAWSGQ